MTFQTDIFNTVLEAKCTAAYWSDIFQKKLKGGDNIDCCEDKLWLLVQWYKILEHYYCQNFPDDAGYVLNENSCLSFSEAQELLAKVKKLLV